MTKTKVEKMKPLEEVLNADNRNAHYVLTNKFTGQARQMTLDDHYESVQSCNLKEYVPVEIIEHYETAKNLYVYSWFSYRFGMVAKRHAITSLEYALREWVEKYDIPLIKKPKGKPGLSLLLSTAIKESSLSAKDFKSLIPEDSYPDKLKDILLHFRNDLSHGSYTLLPLGDALHIIKVVAVIINKVFSNIDSN